MLRQHCDCMMKGSHILLAACAVWLALAEYARAQDPASVAAASAEERESLFRRAVELSSRGRAPESIPLYRSLAESGHVESQKTLARFYLYGRGVPVDKGEAVMWMRRAAEQGDTESMNNMGYLYNRGLGVEQNEAAAVEWFRKAAEHGCVEAMYNVGVSYAAGKGVPKDDSKAAEWYRKAAERGGCQGAVQPRGVLCQRSGCGAR